MPLLKRLQNFFAKPVADDTVGEIYWSCVKQARRPEFYSDLGVPDTVDGRFDMLLLHIFLVMRRLNGKAEAPARQQLFDMLFSDMDQSLREMGVGDMSISRKMKPMIGAFYGRSKAYEEALNAVGPDALEEALQRNVYGKSPPGKDSLKQLAAYVRHWNAALEKQSEVSIMSGYIEFCDPIIT